ncbi:MAG: sugar ABC transporter ATP-binding protein, partial [Anaerolineales bacterium]
MSEYILEMEHISKSFSRVKVLDDVSLKVRAGEVHAIVGENGAGKSTLMKILTGVYSPDGGEIRLHGKKVEIHNPRMALAHGIAMIYQELNPVLDQDVAENIFLGRELIRYHFGPLSIVDKQAQHQHTQELFARMGVDIPSKALMRQLSVAQKQLVEIVKAISLSCSVVVMDEPTSALTEKEVATLFEQIEKLRSQGVAIIYISHRLEEVFKIADTITVLRDGRLIGTDSVSNFDHDKLIRMMVGRNIEEFYPKQNVPIGEVVLEVRNLS